MQFLHCSKIAVPGKLQQNETLTSREPVFSQNREIESTKCLSEFSNFLCIMNLHLVQNQKMHTYTLVSELKYSYSDSDIYH